VGKLKERPIIFSGEMIPAIQDKRKTQTRRVWKPPEKISKGFEWDFHEEVDGQLSLIATHKDSGHSAFHSVIKCPYGIPGDRLWVREAWKVWGWHEGEPITVQFKDGKIFECLESDKLGYEDWEQEMWMQSGDECEKAGMIIDPETDCYTWKGCKSGEIPTRWRSPIHMPRWASRITLEITDVKVARVRDISSKDAYAEGCRCKCLCSEPCPATTYSFKSLWDTINAKKGFGWDVNPWVWVITFKLLTGGS